MKLIDTHCHIDVPVFDDDRTDVLQRCHEAGVIKIIVPAIESSGWKHLTVVCESNNTLFPAFGLHPVRIQQHSDDDLQALKAWAQLNKPLAIGEIGLDFYVNQLAETPLREKQVHFFDEQLIIAQELDLPVILHARKSHDAILQSLKKTGVRGGTCHAFNGSRQQADSYLELGFKLGFGGMITYERSSRLRNLAKILPVEAIVLETDAPDMTVFSHHGQRNSPEYLPECLVALAEIRNESCEYLAEQTTFNAQSVFSFH